MCNIAEEHHTDHRAMHALKAVFHIVSRYRSLIREAWRNVLEVILSLHDLGVLPEGFGFSTFEFEDVKRIERIDAEEANATEEGKVEDTKVAAPGEK